MSLVLPGNIPVATDSLQSLSRIGSARVLWTKATALVLITEDPSDPYSVWASPKLKDYRSVWDADASAGFIDAATEWGDMWISITFFPRAGQPYQAAM